LNKSGSILNFQRGQVTIQNLKPMPQNAQILEIRFTSLNVNLIGFQVFISGIKCTE